jgi:ElaB/YqjD/DUF883 family membrane-anchored ribosome-binding protein
MSPQKISPDMTTAILEQHAFEQRRRMHDTLTDLRWEVEGRVRDVEHRVREKLNVERYAREYVWQAASAAALFSLLFGYGTAGAVKRMVR